MTREERGAVIDVVRDVVSLPDRDPAPVSVTDDIPVGETWRYEPDWDGLHVVVDREQGGVRIRSDRDRPLGRYFPEIVAALDAIPATFRARGSLVVIGRAGFSFDHLRRRIHPAGSYVTRAAARWPATLMMTDIDRVLAPRARARTLSEARDDLLAFAGYAGIPAAPGKLRRLLVGEPITVTSQTPFVTYARRWLDDEDEMGRDGLIARGADGSTIVRVRRLRRAACVVLGYRPVGSNGLGALQLGMVDGERLVEVGRTAAFKRSAARKEAMTALAAAAPGGLRLVGSDGVSDDWVHAPPMVCEVEFERLRGPRFRNAVTFVRWLPDIDPQRCSLAQLLDPASALVGSVASVEQALRT
jgi:ATP-dependent DNA ligase